MKRIAAGLLVWLTACGPRHGNGNGGPAPEQVTLCVQNETVAYGNIVARAGGVRFDVMPGEQVCKRVPGLGPMIALSAVTTAGNLNGPLSYATQLQVSAGGCWTWRLTDSPASAHDVTPCPASANGTPATNP
ncbi:MAG TPA: hypothetical protein VFJ16_19320 [Longimicrobium sp.]|nr:hypothetical protein [Longimicrobium sp.]